MNSADVESMAKGSINTTKKKKRTEETTPAFDASVMRKPSLKKLSKFDGPQKKISNSFLTLQ